jgi:hypothetical protein
MVLTYADKVATVALIPWWDDIILFMQSTGGGWQNGRLAA